MKKLCSNNNFIEKNHNNLLVKLKLNCLLFVVTLYGVTGFALEINCPKPITLNIQSQGMEAAINELAMHSGFRVAFYASENLKRLKSKPVIGQYKDCEAVIKSLLSGTNLRYSVINESFISIYYAEIDNSSAMLTNGALLLAVNGDVPIGFDNRNQEAQFTTNDGESGGGFESTKLIEEVVITASKRAQNLQDTAMAVSALSGENLEKRGLVSMADYLPSIPGVSFQDRGTGQNNLTIRGVGSDQERESKTVGVYFGETPITELGSGSGQAGGSGDIKLVDIERVEVLRGPQGTLFGSNTMGGALRVIPKAPDLEEIGGKTSMSYSNTSGNGSRNNMVQGVLNIPLIEDQLAVRGVAYQYENSGYIKNVAGSQSSASAGTTMAISEGGVAVDRSEAGSDEYLGVRLTTLWKPNKDFDVTLTYMQQQVEQDGFPGVTLADGIGEFEQIRLRSGENGGNDEFLENDIAITSVMLEYDLQWGHVLSATSWLGYDGRNQFDVSGLFFAPIYGDSDVNTEVFTQEIRFASEFEGAFQILAGLYYEDHESRKTLPFNWSGNDFTRELELATAVGLTSADTSQRAFLGKEQYAAFGEFSYDVSDQLTTTVGFRYFDYEQNQRFVSSGYLFGGGSSGTSDDTSGSGENYKANISYTPNDDILIYAQWAEGFRLAQEFFPLTDSCLDENGLVDGLGIALPDFLEPDELESFEVGVKTTFANGRFSVNAAAYRINWDGIPISFVAPTCQQFSTINGGESKSEGVEFELRANLTDSLNIDFNASYNDAVLTEDNSLGSKGDNLPGSADVNAFIALQYDFSLAGNDAFVRGDYAYVGEYFNNVSETGQASGDYGQVNLVAGIAMEHINIELFVKNLTDEDEFTWVESALSGSAYQLRPRTMGINLGYQF